VGARGLGVISWKRLLHRLVEVARAGGDEGAVSDIHQLLGLCEHIENASFIPFRPEEIRAFDVPRRVLDLSRILTGLVGAAVARGLWIRGRVLYNDCSVSYAITIGTFMAYLQFDAGLWRELKLSPIWIGTNLTWEENRGLPVDAAARLKTALIYLGPRCVNRDNSDVVVALEVRAGIGEEELVAHLLAQARTFVQQLHDSGLLAPDSSAAANT
jgi:hypothetical protein